MTGVVQVADKLGLSFDVLRDRALLFSFEKRTQLQEKFGTAAQSADVRVVARGVHTAARVLRG